MKKLTAAAKAIAEKIGLTKAHLAVLRHRHRRQRARADRNRAAQLAAEKRATEARKNGHLKLAADLDKRAARCQHRHGVSTSRAINLRCRIKAIVARLHDLEVEEGKVLAELAEWKKNHKPTISGNKASGGTRRERIRLVLLTSVAWCAGGRRHNFYSQGGSWDVDHCITGPSTSCRDDCSSWATSAHKSAGCPDPNGTNFGSGFTGTMEAHGKQVALSEARDGDHVLYGSPGATHHVEEVCLRPGEKPSRTSRTAGHGSAPVDFGITDLFGDGNFRIFRSIK